MPVTRERTNRARPGQGRTFDSLHPGTGEVVGTFPIQGAEEVLAAVGRAREAAPWWQGLGWRGRSARLRAFQGLLVRRREELLSLISAETGKPRVDALIEHTLVLEHLNWAAGHARKVLGPRRVKGSPQLVNHKPLLEYQPLGVVGVIGPWNYPLFTPMGSIGYALAAGNTVVFKPSEFTPAVGAWLAQAMAEITPEAPVLQTVTGFGETGAALCRAGVDKIAFTGSPPTGRKVMALCAETLTPVLMELGGKDAMIVDDDADVKRAAAAALWGGCANAGQTCAGVERVYVTERVYEAFLTEVTEQASGLSAATASDAAIGPITMPGQIDKIRAHVVDALERGAKAVVGSEESIRPPFVDPIVLVDVPEDAQVMTEETFGPVLPVIKVRDAEDALARANASRYGLGATVYGRRHARDLARRLRSGMVSVNSVLTYPAFASLPFGGIGESGFGRIHGEDGLREFSRPKAIVLERFRLPFELTVFNRPAWLPRMLERMDSLKYGRRR
jgi:acyl-CoA reductase-like NAD-dependent aldehyde dehydrogenase